MAVVALALIALHGACRPERCGAIAAADGGAGRGVPVAHEHVRHPVRRRRARRGRSVQVEWRAGAALAGGAAIVMATLGATALAVAIYYAHFGETYRAEFARIGHETATAAPDAGGRGIGERCGRVPRYPWTSISARLS